MDSELESELGCYEVAEEDASELDFEFASSKERLNPGSSIHSNKVSERKSVQNDFEDDFYSHIEKSLNTQIPVYLKNLLKINGYNSKIVLKNIGNNDFEAIENFAKNDLVEIIPKSEYKNFYGPYFFNSPNKFKITAGDKKLIQIISDFLKGESSIKTFKDKATMTNIETTSIQTTPSEGPSDSSCHKNENKNENELEMLEHDLTIENASVSRIIKKWVCKKISEIKQGSGRDNDLKTDLKNKFNNIVFRTNVSSQGGLNCNITCFCGEKIKIYKQSQKSTFKARWICSNYYCHFSKKHLLSSTFSQSSAEESSLTTNLTTSHSQNVKLKKEDGERGGQITQKKITLFFSGSNDNLSNNSSSSTSSALLSFNKLLLKPVKSVDNRVFQAKHVQPSKATDIDTSTHDQESQKNPIRVVQCLKLKNFMPVPDTSEAISLKGSSEESDYKKNMDKYSDEHSDEHLKSSHNDNNRSTPPQKSKALTSPQVENLKWKSLKYSRTEREVRKREKCPANQTLITNFLPILEKVQTLISEQNENLDENLLKSFKGSFSIQGSSEPGSEPLTTNKLLEIFLKAANNNKDFTKRNSFENNLKKFALYIYYTGGKLLYETLYANLSDILPSLSTLYRFSLSNKISVEEGELNLKGLKLFLEERNLPMVVWISEDATRITGKIEYNSRTNNLQGFVSPLENGFPQKGKFTVRSCNDMDTYFKEGVRGDYAYVIMAQPLSCRAPAFCLAVFNTDNRFTYKNVLERWGTMKSQASELGIKILGFSSDGDTRLLKAMKTEAHFTQVKTSNSDCYSSWYHIDSNINDYCFIQDPIHIMTKLKTRFLKAGVCLPMGNYFATSQHLYHLIDTENKSKHFLTKSDLKAEDKMNYRSAKKMCDDKVINLLKGNIECKATVLYLKLMNFLNDSLVNKADTLDNIVYKLWYITFFLRYWRSWLKSNAEYKLKDNFITCNAYTCIEINSHMIVKIIKLFQNNPALDPSMLLLYLFNSQPCEKLFRAARSLTSTQSTVVNFSIKQLMSRVDRITFIQFILNDLKEYCVFPRERKKEHEFYSKGVHQVTQQEINNISFQDLIEKAMTDAYTDAVSFGMNIDKEEAMSCNISVANGDKNIEMNLNLNESEDESDDDEEQKDQEKRVEIETENGKEDIESEEFPIVQTFLNNDLQLHSHFNSDNENTVTKDIDLKDYSHKNVDLSENSIFLKVILPSTFPNVKTAVIKKSSYCWMLDEGNGRVSTDRLKRFITGKRSSGSTSTVVKAKKGRRNIKNTIKERGIEKKELSESSDSADESENIIYNDSDDTESFTSLEEKNTLVETKVQNMPDCGDTSGTGSVVVEVEVDKCYGVLYDDGWYIGKVLKKINNEVSLMSFLRQQADLFNWPNKKDIAKVNKEFIFYGPLNWIGDGPFSLKRVDSLNINKNYKLLKESLLE